MRYVLGWFDTGHSLNIEIVFPDMGISTIDIRRSWNRLIFIMQIPLLARRYLNTETGTMSLLPKSTGLIHCQLDNHTIAPVSMSQPWMISWWPHASERFPYHRLLWGKSSSHRWFILAKGNFLCILSWKPDRNIESAELSEIWDAMAHRLFTHGSRKYTINKIQDIFHKRFLQNRKELHRKTRYRLMYTMLGNSSIMIKAEGSLHCAI